MHFLYIILKKNIFWVLVTVVSISMPVIVYGQNCIPDHFFNRYQGTNAVYVNKVITTTKNETLTAGSCLKVRGDFEDATDGFINKVSARGTILWSKRYFIPGFNSGGFSSIENATDSTYLVTARFGVYKKVNFSTVIELDAATFLLYLDKYGNLIWKKRITNYINDSFLNNITKTTNNSFIITGNKFRDNINQLMVLNIDLTGNVNWHKLIFVDSVHLTRPVTKVLANGSILLTGITFKAGFTNQGYYFIKMDNASGEVSLSKNIYIGPNPVYEIKSILELPNDSLMLCTSFAERQGIAIAPYSKEATLLKVSATGQVGSATSFYTTNPGCELLDAVYSNSAYTMLLDNGFQSMVVTLNSALAITGQKAYGQVNGNIKAKKLLDRLPANRILFTGRTQVSTMGLMKTESDWSIPCLESSTQMTIKDISSFYSNGNLSLSYVNTSPINFEEILGGIGRTDYVFNTYIDCFASCCSFIKSDTTTTELCNAKQYVLPDNSVVKESGIYYGIFSTPNNCDSIAYYDILFSKKPIVNLGDAVCLGDSTSVLLKTDSAYRQYIWNGMPSPNHYYKATAPGIYSVSVTNQCGTTRDEIEVFQKCEFPVYIPSAFTPNNDGLNDNFGYPIQNKNRFVSLSIFNRFGERIFFTTDKSKSWNGQYKRIIQPNGIYAYLLYLTTLDGKKISQKGTFMLIR
jgi:gliding motility-associated-like protein